MSRVEGVEDVMAYFDRELKKIGGPMTNKFVTEVLIGAGANIAKYIPVDTSNLINSEYRRTWKGQDQWSGELGYGADYAYAVNYGPQKNWQKSGASNRFIQKGVRDMTDNDLPSIIKRSYKI